MNHLAHIHLSRHQPETLMGNLCADMFKGSMRQSLTVELQKGIWIHNHIDRYTDAHPLVHRMKARLIPHFGKYSGVLLDILMDHQLAQHWHMFSDLPFGTACEEAYRDIRAGTHLLPEATAHRIQGMLNSEWLHHFAHSDGLKTTLKYLAQRAKFADDFSSLCDLYRVEKGELDILFMEFYPELDGYVRLRVAEL
jgi:acyl carrier protein phosphodiesterase